MLFGLFTILWLIIAAIYVPKKNTTIELYATSTFAVAFGVAVDEILDLKYDLYGFLNPGVDFLGETSQLSMYSTANIIFLSLFPYNGTTFKKIIYILACSLFSAFYEYFAVQTTFFYYNRWSAWLSLSIYPVLFLILIGNLKLVRLLIKKHNEVLK